MYSAKNIKNVFILIKDIPLCFNSHNKTVYYNKTQQYYIIIGILLWQHVSVFL